MRDTYALLIEKFIGPALYAAWVSRADQQASELLAARLPAPRPPTQ